MRALRFIAGFALSALLVSGCVRHLATEITRDRAVDIARSQVSFTPSSVDVVKASAGGRPIWRVTIRGRLPGQPPELFETRIVEIDRVTGVVVSVARS
jgi:hypothetical protein